MNIELQQLTAEDAVTYLDSLWPRYQEELIRAGSSPAEADANIQRNKDAISPGGQIASGQFMFRVLLNGDHIGNLWLAQRSADDWFIYDIEVHEGFRGRGLGRAAMGLAEAFARENGARNLGLSVFGFNTVARSLYESLGYSILSMGMVKSLR